MQTNFSPTCQHHVTGWSASCTVWRTRIVTALYKPPYHPRAFIHVWLHKQYSSGIMEYPPITNELHCARIQKSHSITITHAQCVQSHVARVTKGQSNGRFRLGLLKSTNFYVPNMSWKALCIPRDIQVRNQKRRVIVFTKKVDKV